MQKLFTQRFQGIVLVFLAAILWSTIGVFVKILNLPAPTILLYRSLFAALFLFIVSRVLLKRKVYKPSSWIDFGIICFYASASIFFILSNTLTTAANAVFLQYVFPIFIFIFHVLFLKYKIKLLNVLTLTLSMLGIGLFFLEKGTSSQLLGNILGLSTGLVIAGYTLLTGFKKSDVTLDLIILGSLLIAFVMFPFVRQFSLFAFQWVILLFLGCMQIGMAYFLFNKALQKISTEEVAIYILLEPVLNPIWVFVFVGERPSLFAFLGGVLILGALAIKILFDKGK